MSDEQERFELMFHKMCDAVLRDMEPRPIKPTRDELRDRFAMAALTGVLAHPTRFNNFYDDVAESAWDYADAMMKARGDA